MVDDTTNGRTAPTDPRERGWAVRLQGRIETVRDVLSGAALRRALRRARGQRWPVAPGAYVVGDPVGPVAVCTLTSDELPAAAGRLPGVAIAGRLLPTSASAGAPFIWDGGHGRRRPGKGHRAAYL